jgi:hypothetical protein
VNGVN